MNAETPPTLYEWAGGSEAFERLTAAFYEKVKRDELLEPVFREMDPGHPHHVAVWLAEVFGGPPLYVEWGTRLALVNTQPGANPPREAPVPRWGWGEAPPYTPA